ncbi:MAG: hypothetical protein A3J79_03915 [Elusimicrobia bacterium RIFOXYB2_FULL_62_6]|nr:MAG: hypothetical protein A3J79_03915 [Elusimicrobia bacterium RIFOXYB2_FULL_62_6]
MIKNKLVFTLILSLFTAAGVLAAKPGPAEKKAAAAPSETAVIGLKVLDMPYDVGGTALLKWDVRPEDTPETLYQVYVSSLDTGGWIKADEFPANTRTGRDIELPFWAWASSTKEHVVKVELPNYFNEKQATGSVFRFKVAAVAGKKTVESEVVSGVTVSNWFRLDRLNNLLLLIVVIVVFFWAVSHAKRKGLFIRRIAGLDAIDEALGRATEMGKPVYYVTGIGGMAGISTIASTFILGEVAKKVAQYDTQIKVPHYDPIVMTVCKEVVKQSFLEAGRPDSYRDDINFFVSQDQFSYAASVDGMISREKPAAIFFMGYFMAESLLLAEVGATSGAIQIAGTDVEHQLPFFFTACDYTLIGEELYAAGAYLSKEPMLLSALKVQDFGKLVVMLSVLFGIVLVAVGAKMEWDSLVRFILNTFWAY